MLEIKRNASETSQIRTLYGATIARCTERVHGEKENNKKNNNVDRTN